MLSIFSLCARPPRFSAVVVPAVYVSGLAGGCTPGGRHTATTEGKKPRGGMRVRMEFCYALVECELHAHLRTALAEHGSNITSRFAIRDKGEGESEDEDDLSRPNS